MANRISFAGAKFSDFKADIAIMAPSCLHCLGPLYAFSPALAHAKHTGLRITVLWRSARSEFDHKWLRADAHRHGESPAWKFGHPVAADLSGSFDVITPCGWRILAEDSLTARSMVVLPVLPLSLTMTSLEETLKLLLKLVSRRSKRGAGAMGPSDSQAEDK